MREFMFYTLEGYTEGPHGEEVDNCQLLGRETGENVNQAAKKLIEKNPWIEEAGFNVGEMLFVEIVNNDI